MFIVKKKTGKEEKIRGPEEAIGNPKQKQDWNSLKTLKGLLSTPLLRSRIITYILLIDLKAESKIKNSISRHHIHQYIKISQNFCCVLEKSYGFDQISYGLDEMSRPLTLFLFS